MTIGSGLAARLDRGALRIALILLLPLFATGCLQMERVVQVRGDGSGVLIERVVMSSEIIEMMASMQAEGKPFSIRDDGKLRGNATNFGESVRFLSASDVQTDFGKGYEARYAFADINRLRVGHNVDDHMQGDGGMSANAESEEPKFTTFTLRGSNPAELVIHWPVNEVGSEPESRESPAGLSQGASSPEQQQMAMKMMKMAFRDMRMAMHVEVVGDILETNAMHSRGARVTLMDIAFGELLSSEAALESMVGKKPETVADLKELMKLVPGLKLEIEPEIAIRFQ